MPRAMVGRSVVSERPHPQGKHPGRIEIEIPDGIVLVGSDAHYWPGAPSLMHRMFVRLCKEMRPDAVVMNGDVVDLQTISRHQLIGWQKLPQVVEEIDVAKDRMHEIEQACGRALKIWPLGNHDARFSTYIANKAPELAQVAGVELRDHFPLWEPCWSVWVNGDTVIKHRFRAGIHASWNNVMNAGTNIITGHLHSAKVIPFTNLLGTTWGVDTGCIADIDHVAFLDWTEDNPKNWRSGFCVLTFRGGQLLPPELVLRWSDNEVVFRGQIIQVSEGNACL